MDTEQTRNLARAIAPLLPGEWHAEWEDHTVGAYLDSGSLRLFVSAQTGYGHKPGMVRISPQLPSGPAWEDPDNKSKDIWVSEDKSPTLIVRDITRRILEAQHYPAKVSRQVAAHEAYRASEDAALALAGRLAAILDARTHGDGTQINAHPHGNWSVQSNSAHLDIYLPRELAVRIARLLMEEM